MPRHAQWENTLVVISADNGGPLAAGANNYPLRGGKFSNLDGGIRVNAWVTGGYLPKARRGKKEGGLIALWDWWATFSALGGALPADVKSDAFGLPAIDSLNMWPLISGADTKSPRENLIIGAPSVTTATVATGAALLMHTVVQGIIEPPYKLLLGNVGIPLWTSTTSPNSTDAAAGSVPTRAQGEASMLRCGDPMNVVSHGGGTGCLFNIYDDPSEQKNLAGDPAHKATVARLREAIATAQKTAVTPGRGLPNAGTEMCTQIRKQGDFIGPFVFNTPDQFTPEQQKYLFPNLQ